MTENSFTTQNSVAPTIAQIKTERERKKLINANFKCIHESDFSLKSRSVSYKRKGKRKFQIKFNYLKLKLVIFGVWFRWMCCLFVFVFTTSSVSFPLNKKKSFTMSTYKFEYTNVMHVSLVRSIVCFVWFFVRLFVFNSYLRKSIIVYEIFHNIFHLWSVLLSSLISDFHFSQFFFLLFLLAVLC